MPKPSRQTPISAITSTAAVATEPVIDENDLAPLPQFMLCKCIGALPGRCCPRCSGTKWLKRCLSCNGSGLLFKNSRKGAEPRSERCGNCMGNGWLSCMPSDRAAIDEFNAAQVATPTLATS